MPKTESDGSVTQLETEESVVESGEPAYSKLEFTEYSVASPTGPMYPADAKRMLGWETEPEYQKRMVTEHPGDDPDKWLFDDDFHCHNAAGEKVRCHRNAGNRPFDALWSEALRDTVLRGRWAGPHTVPGETVNGETIRISKHGRMLSGQHQCTGLIWADEWLQKYRAKPDLDSKYPAWDGHEHPFIESLVVTGISEDERVLRTIDYVKPRTVADMLFTMEIFRQNKPHERKELTRMLSSAIDVLWARTDTKGYKTHPEVVGFLERHRRLLRCVEQLFLEDSTKAGNEWECKNCRMRFSQDCKDVACMGGKAQYDKMMAHACVRREGRRISRLHLSAGTCAGLCYLMGCSGSKTDGDAYRDPPEGAPCEKGLDWSLFDKALDFWTRLASDKGFLPVRTKLSRLTVTTTGNEDNKGLGGRIPEKLAVIVKAWDAFKDYDSTSRFPPFSEEDLEEPDGVLCLAYSTVGPPRILNGETINGEKLPEGQIRLVDEADFKGIDCPEALTKNKVSRTAINAPPMPKAPTEKEIEKATEEARARREKHEEQKRKLEENRRIRRS